MVLLSGSYRCRQEGITGLGFLQVVALTQKSESSMYRVNSQVITMVQGELEKEVQALMQLLEDAGEQIDSEAFAEHLHTLGGAIRLLELSAEG